MDSRDRYKRLRQLFRKLNIERKKQAQKIDILCNNFIAAHGDFIKTLQTINFTTNFYESIVGETELDNLLDTVGRMIKEQVGDANVAVFLRWQNSFKLHLFENSPISLEKQDIANCFTPELVDNICKANKQCNLDELLKRGLQTNPTLLKDITFIALMLPILICSYLTLAIIIERLLFFRSFKKFNRAKIIRALFDYVRKKKVQYALSLCEDNPYYLTNIFF